jgi:limonene-1,2-epoxide hydrolase
MEQEAVVLEFLGYFRDGWPEDFDAPLALMTEDASYQIIVPVTPPVRGRRAIKKAWQLMAARMESQKHELLAVGSSDRFVFTERVDHSLIGGHWDDVPLVAVFEVNEENRIVAWREYLDSANVAAQQGITVDELFGRRPTGAGK